MFWFNVVLSNKENNNYNKKNIQKKIKNSRMAIWKHEKKFKTH